MKFDKIKEYQYSEQPYFLFTNVYKRLLEVEISKALMAVINCFGFTAYFSGFILAWINVDMFTRTCLGLVGLAFMAWKLWMSIDNHLHKRRMNQIERRRAEIEQMKREDEYIRNTNL